MDDSDEYFDDFFVLDETALASIQETEERFGASLSQARRSQPASPLQASPSPPPSKRLKTSGSAIEHGVARVPPRPVFRRVESLDHLNPEIRVGPDGNYVFSTQSEGPKQAGATGGVQNGLAPLPSAKMNLITVSAGDGCSSSGATANSVHLADAGISSASQRRARIIEQALAEVSAQSQIPAAAIPRDIAQPDEADIHTELASLRAQLAASNAENAVIQKSLREAQDAQLVKAGEVSILRQTIDKTKKEHDEAVAKAKADMIAHEKMKAELHAKLKEETERMTTRLVFQQHEMETSSRKPTRSSVRSKRIAKDPSMSTPAFAATPTRGQGPFLPPSTSRPARRLSLAQSDQGRGEDNAPLSSPTSGYGKMRSGEDAKRPQFKGFHNAFIDTEPVMGQNVMSDKEENIEENQRSDPFLTPIKPNDSRDVDSRDLSNGKWKGKDREVNGDYQFHCWEGNAHGLEVKGREDIIAVDQEEGRAPSLQSADKLAEEDIVIEEGVYWGEELRRIIFTHIAPQNDTLTLHILLSTIIPSETPIGDKHAYTMACQVILETCGTRHGRTQYSDDSEWEEVIHKVANAFMIIGGTLARTGCVAPLTALLDLLLLLTLYIPAFVSPLLSLPTADAVVDQLDLDKPSQLLCMLCTVVQEHLASPKSNSNVAKNTTGKKNAPAPLAMVVVQLMESLCWTANDHLMGRLGVLPRHPRVFEILLDPAQPPELITRTLRLLVLLATREISGWCPPLEKLCYYLVEPAAEESYGIRHLVITLIGVLADSHIEARTLLLDSVTLAPSLVICIANLSKLLWEDDLTMNDANLAKLTVDILYLSVNLLHHLVFVLDLSSVLGRKLMEATRLSGPFNGVTHMFIVTFGRLSWAEGPDWLDKDCKDRCEVIAEYAVEIIETVITGPECDSLWAVWHQFDMTDEEELEAWKIQIE